MLSILLELMYLDAVRGRNEERNKRNKLYTRSTVLSTGVSDEEVRRRHKFSERGSMLIEAIVAISIFMVGFGSVLALNAQALHIVPQVSKRLIASQLAQEGVEIVRNHITTNAIRGNPFNLGLSDGHYPVFSDVAEGPVVGPRCSSASSCQTALFLPTSGSGNYTINFSGKPTPFRRIVVTNTTRPHEVQVNSIVTWDDSIPSMTGCATSEGNCINVEDHLFDWQ